MSAPQFLFLTKIPEFKAKLAENRRPYSLSLLRSGEIRHIQGGTALDYSLNLRILSQGNYVLLLQL